VTVELSNDHFRIARIHSEFGHRDNLRERDAGLGESVLGAVERVTPGRDVDPQRIGIRRGIGDRDGPEPDVPNGLRLPVGALDVDRDSAPSRSVDDLTPKFCWRLRRKN